MAQRRHTNPDGHPTVQEAEMIRTDHDDTERLVTAKTSATDSDAQIAAPATAQAP